MNKTKSQERRIVVVLREPKGLGQVIRLTAEGGGRRVSTSLNNPALREIVGEWLLHVLGLELDE